MTALQIVVLALFFILCRPAMAQFSPVQKSDICKRLPLPTVSFNAKFTINPRQGFVLETDDSREKDAQEAQRFLQKNEPTEPLEKVKHLIKAGESASIGEDKEKSQNFYRRAMETALSEAKQANTKRRIEYLNHALTASLAIEDWVHAEETLRQLRQVQPNTYKTAFAENRYQYQRLTSTIFDQGIREEDKRESSKSRQEAEAEFQRLKTRYQNTMDQMEREIPDPRKRDKDVYQFGAVLVMLSREFASSSVASNNPTAGSLSATPRTVDPELVGFLEKALLGAPADPLGIATAEFFRVLVDPSQVRMVLTRFRQRIHDARNSQPFSKTQQLDSLKAELIFCLISENTSELDATLPQALKLAPDDNLLFQIQMIAFSKDKRISEAERRIRERLRTNDTLGLRHLLCRMLEKQEKWEALQIEAKIAGEKYPQEALLPLFEIGAQLKRFGGQLDADALTEIQTTLDRYTTVDNDNMIARRYYQTLAAVAVCAGQRDRAKDTLAQLKRIDDEEEEDEEDEAFAETLLACLK